MILTPLLSMLRQGQLFPALAAKAMYKPFYRLTFLAALKESGMMAQMAHGPASLAQLASVYTSDEKQTRALQAWLQMGCRADVLRRDHQGYSLKGLARKLARPENDATLALVQEVAGLHHQLIARTPATLRAGGLWGLENQDGELTARSSRALEAFQVEIIRRFIPRARACNLLEIGCGSAIYIRHAAMLNPSLTAIGLELQGDVAQAARENIKRWGLESRVQIKTGDVRSVALQETFDLATLYNIIYYFSLDERTALLRTVKRHLAPGGALLLTTCCQGGNLGMEALNLWGASNQHGDPLPRKHDVIAGLEQTGYDDIQTLRLLPGDSFYAFHARA